jgi:redox-sensitive bicupin YhaK (pirin superfamily)
MVGAWCFLDEMGPHDVGEGPGMRIGPHPHIGLQTVTWLVRGEVLHRDSLGSRQLVRGGELNLMTAGHGIAHSEESVLSSNPLRPDDPILHGVQLWTALPAHDRAVTPHFEHHADLPRLTMAGAEVTVFLGELAGMRSPARTYSPIVGADVTLGQGAEFTLALRPGFEYAVLMLAGTADVAGEALERGPLLYLGTGRDQLRLRSMTPDRSPTRLLLIGGEPFDERIVMWWNFVGRTHAEIAQARGQWAAGERFGEVQGYDGDAIPAPPLPATPLLPRGRVR